MTLKYCRIAWLLLLAFSGCAVLSPDFEEPKVVLDSLEMLPTNGINQRFKIGLRMTNPNDKPLKIKGISYTVALNGYDLLDGVGNNIPEVAPYSEVLFDVEASTNMFETLRFINNFMGGKSQGELNYRLQADIAVDGWFKKVAVEESGVVPLSH